jgi:hypothetical protein
LRATGFGFGVFGIHPRRVVDHAIRKLVDRETRREREEREEQRQGAAEDRGYDRFIDDAAVVGGLAAQP